MNMKLRFHAGALLYEHEASLSAKTKTFFRSLIPLLRRNVTERRRTSLLFSGEVEPVFSQPDRAGL